MLSKGTQPDALPPPSRLEAVVRNLTASKDHRALITFVQRWSAYTDPPDMARVAEARAFLELAQVDRAWIRIQDLAKQPDASVEVLTLAARIFLARGWPTKAREYLNRALADGSDERVQRLWDLAAEPTSDPHTPSDELMRAAGDPGKADQLADLAAELLKRGQRVVAKRALERVVALHPEHERARDLLWGLNGLEADGGSPHSLMELTNRYAPIQYALGDFIDENTESITSETLRSVPDLVDESGGHHFPSLFRSGPEGGGVDEEDELTDEITRTQLHAPGPRPLDTIGVDTLPSEDAFDDADTRIVRVRGRDGLPELMHKASAGPTQGFDFDAYRREMGMPIPPTFDAELEDEDDDLVLLTGRERHTPSPVEKETDPTQSQIGREVAHLMGGRMPRTAAKPTPKSPPASTPRAPSPVQDRARTNPAATSPETPPSIEPSGPPSVDPEEDWEADALPRRPLWPWLIVLAVTALIAAGTLALFVLTVLLR